MYCICCSVLDAKLAQSLVSALESGCYYLEVERPRAAKPRLQRYVRGCPEDAAGHSALGLCWLQLGEAARALRHLTRAAKIEPQEPLHQWNIAAAHKQLNRHGNAYLSLRAYLDLAASDDSDDSDERPSQAKKYVLGYEQMLLDVHGTEADHRALALVLRGRRQFASAYAALSEGDVLRAARGFVALLEVVPDHSASLGNLSAAYLLRGRHAAARFCAERALALAPEYAVARHTLQLLGEMDTTSKLLGSQPTVDSQQFRTRKRPEIQLRGTVREAPGSFSGF